MLKGKAVGTLIRETDVQHHEVECLNRKMSEHWNWIGIEARNTLDEGVRAGALKCVAGHNQGALGATKSKRGNAQCHAKESKR